MDRACANRGTGMDDFKWKWVKEGEWTYIVGAGTLIIENIIMNEKEREEIIEVKEQNWTICRWR